MRRLIDWIMRRLIPDVYARLELLEMQGITPLIKQEPERLILVQSADWCAKRKQYQVTVRIFGRKSESRTVMADTLTDASILRALR